MLYLIWHLHLRKLRNRWNCARSTSMHSWTLFFKRYSTRLVYWNHLSAGERSPLLRFHPISARRSTGNSQIVSYFPKPAHLKDNPTIFPDPTFFGCICGKAGNDLPGATSLGSGQGEKRVSSVGAAVEFAKANNMLGLFVDASLLVRSSFFFSEHRLKISHRLRFLRWLTAFGVPNFLLVYMGFRESGSV